MAKRLYVGNAPLSTQVDRLTIPITEYLQQHLSEGSTITATINEKTITGRVPYREAGPDGTKGPFTSIDDSLAAKLLLADLKEKWDACAYPEFKEIKCTGPKQDDSDGWYLDFTCNTAGLPYEVGFSAPLPAIDVDTVRNGAVGTDAEFTFQIDEVATGGSFVIQWDLGSGVETSALIPYPVTNADSVLSAIVAGMPSITPDDITVTVASGVVTLKLRGALASTTVGVPEIITTNLTGGGQVFSATIRDGNSGTVTDTFSGSSPHVLGGHTSDTGQGWTVTGANAAWLYVSGGKLRPDLAYTGGSYNFDHNSKAISQYDGVTDALASVSVSNWGIWDWWLHHVPHGTTIGDGFYQPVITYAFTAGIKLHTRHDTDNDTVYLHVTIDPEDNGGRAAKSTTLNATGKTGTMTVAIKKVVGGTTTTIATTTVDRDFATWKYNGSAHVYATSTGGGYGVASGNLIAPLEDSAMSLDIKVVSGTVTAHVVDSTGVTTTVTGSLGTFTGTGTKYGMSFDFSTDGQNTTSISAYPLTLDNFSIIDANDPDERQSLWTNGTGGTFDAMDDAETVTAADIPATVSRAALQVRLEEIYGAGGISVYGGSGTETDPWLLRYIGTNSATNMAQIKGNGDNLTGIAQATVETINLGSPGVSEQWSLSITGATGGTYTPTIRGTASTIPVAYNGDADDVKASINDIEIVNGSGELVSPDCEVTGAGTISDPFIITLGEDFQGIDIRQLVVLPDDLTGDDFPHFIHETISEADGPWNWEHDLNWINADTNVYGIPQNGDSLHFEFGNQNRCPRFNIDQHGLTVISIDINPGFANQAVIGLPRMNPNGYYEYRNTELKIKLSTNKTIRINAPTPLVKINTLDTETALIVNSSGSPLSGELGAVVFQGTHADNTVQQVAGSVAVAPYVGNYATIDSYVQRGGASRIGHGVTMGDIYRASGAQMIMDRVSVNGVIEVV